MNLNSPISYCRSEREEAYNTTHKYVSGGEQRERNFVFASPDKRRTALTRRQPLTRLVLVLRRYFICKRAFSN